MFTSFSLSLAGQHIHISGKGICMYGERVLGGGIQKSVDKGIK